MKNIDLRNSKDLVFWLDNNLFAQIAFMKMANWFCIEGVASFNFFSSNSLTPLAFSIRHWFTELSHFQDSPGIGIIEKSKKISTALYNLPALFCPRWNRQCSFITLWHNIEDYNHYTEPFQSPSQSINIHRRIYELVYSRNVFMLLQFFACLEYEFH